MRQLVVQLSDMHLSGARAYNVPGWDACLAYTNAQRPAFVAITGDLVLDDPDAAADHAFARSELNRLTSPWAALPGNHDIGDTEPDPHMGQYVDEIRRQRFVTHFGLDRWFRDIADWRVVGINSLLLGGDSPAEAEQADWLRSTLSEAGDRPIALFMHKPIGLHRLDERATTSWCVTAEGQRRLMSLLQGSPLKLVASGHAHIYRSIIQDGITMVWAPSTSPFHGRATRPFGGVRRPGLVEYWFDGDAVEFGMVEPPGAIQFDVADMAAAHRSMRFAPPLTPDEARAKFRPSQAGA